MVLGKQTAGLGLVALTMLVAGAGFEARGQGATAGATGATGATGQQSIPDAPRPQALPQLNTIKPVGVALPSAAETSAASDGATAPASDQAAPGTSLPASSAAPSSDGQDQGTPPEGLDTFKLHPVEVNFVEIPFTVKDSKNHLVPGLTWRDVQVYENGQRQQMRLFTVDPYPLSVALVIDQSVTFDTMTKINNALGALQGAFTPYDEVAVFTYNSSVREQTDFLAAQSARLGVIIDRSKAVGREPNMAMGGALDQGLVKNNEEIDPNTNGTPGQHGITLYAPKEFHPLNDAILAAAESLAHAGKGRRRIVYVISEGKEYGSTAKEREVIKYCQANKVAIYATLVGDSAVPGLGFLDRIHLPLTMRDNALARYTGATGGETDPEFRQKGIETSFAKITEEVRTQYTAGYYSHEPMIDGKFRKVEVQVMKPNLSVIAKEGYYPTASDSRPMPVTPSATP